MSDFTSLQNAVTPIPSWPIKVPRDRTVPISNKAPRLEYIISRLKCIKKKKKKKNKKKKKKKTNPKEEMAQLFFASSIEILFFSFLFYRKF